MGTAVKKTISLPPDLAMEAEERARGRQDLERRHSGRPACRPGGTSQEGSPQHPGLLESEGEREGHPHGKATGALPS